MTKGGGGGFPTVRKRCTPTAVMVICVNSIA